jgi:hypothetical protein
MPSSPKEFREFAQECLRWADETKSERHRQVLLDMAATSVGATKALSGANEPESEAVMFRPSVSRLELGAITY